MCRATSMISGSDGRPQGIPRTGPGNYPGHSSDHTLAPVLHTGARPDSTAHDVADAAAQTGAGPGEIRVGLHNRNRPAERASPQADPGTAHPGFLRRACPTPSPDTPAFCTPRSFHGFPHTSLSVSLARQTAKRHPMTNPLCITSLQRGFLPEGRLSAVNPSRMERPAPTTGRARAGG